MYKRTLNTVRVRTPILFPDNGGIPLKPTDSVKAQMFGSRLRGYVPDDRLQGFSPAIPSLRSEQAVLFPFNAFHNLLLQIIVFNKSRFVNRYR